MKERANYKHQTEKSRTIAAEEQKKLQSEIEAKMKVQMDGIVHAPYAFTIGEHISPIRTCDGDCPVTLSKIKGYR